MVSIDCKEIENFLNKYVRIRVPHDIIPDKLFFYFGWLKYVDNLEIKIETSNGFRIIPIGNILDIHLAKGDAHKYDR